MFDVENKAWYLVTIYMTFLGIFMTNLGTNFSFMLKWTFTFTFKKRPAFLNICILEGTFN